MRKLILAAAASLAFAAPAAAGTLEEVVSHGIILTIQGMDIDVTYTPDGKFTAMDGQVTGEWRTDGEKLCTKSDLGEGCTAYPAGKKAGDSFKITSPTLGEATVTINK